MSRPGGRAWFWVGSVLLLLGIGERLFAQELVPAWRLMWQDEFDQPDGSMPNSGRWNYDVGGSGWGNQELQYYTTRLENARVEGGNLVIEARKETYRVGEATWNYTSARLKTENRRDWAYGRFEARMKLPGGVGLWPAFWLLGSNWYESGWPSCGEIDIMENIGSQPHIVFGGAHGPGYSGPGGSLMREYSLPDGSWFREGFHQFAIEWEYGVIRWYVDNVNYFTLTPDSLPLNCTWVFNHRFFIILNVAVGGVWPGNPLPTTVFPQRMLVDYVRVYTRTSAPAPNLRVSRTGDEVEVFWPADFPHARLQWAETMADGAWTDIATTGTLRENEFVARLSSGFYRLVMD